MKVGDTIKRRQVIFFLSIVFLSLLFSGTASALEKVIANSADWRDVYSASIYASLTDRYPALFLTSARHGTILLYSVPKDTNGTLIVSSRSQPYIVNYKATMEAQGYRDIEELISNTINIELARRVSNEIGINKFIIVDDAYGYNALSCAAYAILDKYYVLFASDRNIAQVDSFLSSVNPENVIIFGQVDESVKTRPL